jgi:mono/diheme cytochrome c family protein
MTECNSDRAKRVSFCSWVLIVLCVLTAGCDLPGKPEPSEQYVAPHKEMSFNVLFHQNCAGCHGKIGTLGPAPPLLDKLFLAIIPEAELRRVVSEGRAGTLMPAFAEGKGGPLTADQINVLVETMKPRGGQLPPAATGAPPYLVAQDPAAQAGNIEAGRKVFARACAGCHGGHGQGGKDVGAINDVDFLALISDQALRRIVITGRPDLGMPDYADPKDRPKDFQPLTSQEVTDVVALLASWRGGGSADAKGK